MAKALVLGGATGLLGQALTRVLKAREWEVATLGRENGNLLDMTYLQTAIADAQADVVFNTVAWTAVDDAEDHKVLFTALSTMRIPLEYMAELFTAGDPRPVEKALRRLVAMRSYMRDINLGDAPNEEIAAAVGLSGQQVEDMYRLLAIANYDERYVIPQTHSEIERRTEVFDPMGCPEPGGGVGAGPVPLKLEVRPGGAA